MESDEPLTLSSRTAGRTAAVLVLGAGLLAGVVLWLAVGDHGPRSERAHPQASRRVDPQRERSGVAVGSEAEPAERTPREAVELSGPAGEPPSAPEPRAGETAAASVESSEPPEAELAHDEEAHAEASLLLRLHVYVAGASVEHAEEPVRELPEPGTLDAWAAGEGLLPWRPGEAQELHVMIREPPHERIRSEARCDRRSTNQWWEGAVPPPPRLQDLPESTDFVASGLGASGGTGSEAAATLTLRRPAGGCWIEVRATGCRPVRAWLEPVESVQDVDTRGDARVVVLRSH